MRRASDRKTNSLRTRCTLSARGVAATNCRALVQRPSPQYSRPPERRIIQSPSQFNAGTSRHGTVGRTRANAHCTTCGGRRERTDWARRASPRERGRRCPFSFLMPRQRGTPIAIRRGHSQLNVIRGENRAAGSHSVVGGGCRSTSRPESRMAMKLRRSRQPLRGPARRITTAPLPAFNI